MPRTTQSSPPPTRVRGGSAKNIVRDRTGTLTTASSSTTTRSERVATFTSSYDQSSSSASFSYASSSPASFDGPLIGNGATTTSSKVLLSDDQMLRRVLDVRNQIDFDALLADRLKRHWKRRPGRISLPNSKSSTSDDITLFTRSREDSRRSIVELGKSQPQQHRHRRRLHEVLAAGEIRCSTQELANILVQSSSEVDYNAVMTALYKKEYIYGSIVHAASTSLGGGDEEELGNSPVDGQLCVKTSSFARSNIFMRNEQWCFLEHFQRDVTKDDAFTLTLSSLLESEVTTGKVKKHHGGRVDQLHDLVAGYSVERISGSVGSVRVVFHGSFSGDNTEIEGNASASMTKSRLLTLAKGVRELPGLVRRRRLGVQTLADRSAFQATNTRCICCTKSLHLLSKKKRCFLCGYFVCDKDWSLQRMETARGHVTPIRVCTRCLEAVECADYSEINAQSLGIATVQRDLPDQSPADKANALGSSTSKNGRTLATFLQDALRTSTQQRKQSVKTVIKYLVTEEHRRLSEDNEPIVSPVILTETSDETEYISALDQYFDVPPLPLQKCVLANNERRAYPIEPVDDPTSAVPSFPVPHDEEKRLSAIEQGNLMDLTNADELNIICTLAARELNCSLGLVTIVGPDSQLILASNVDAFKMVSMPREQSFCQHAVMDVKPLLVPHPEADVRFAHLGPLKQNNIKFYCGFPILDQTNAVVGTMCCLDTKSHDLTQSQYSSMKRLAETASRVVRLKSQESATAAGYNARQ